jgi:hypothetical protein
MFIDKFYKIFIVFYVNDFQIFYYKNNKVYAHGFITKLYETYNLYNLKNIKFFLGIHIIHDRVTKII